MFLSIVRRRRELSCAGPRERLAGRAEAAMDNAPWTVPRTVSPVVGGTISMTPGDGVGDVERDPLDRTRKPHQHAGGDQRHGDQCHVLDRRLPALHGSTLRA
jgi:hypothetical protein